MWMIGAVTPTKSTYAATSLSTAAWGGRGGMVKVRRLLLPLFPEVSDAEVLSGEAVGGRWSLLAELPVDFGVGITSGDVARPSPVSRAAGESLPTTDPRSLFVAADELGPGGFIVELLRLAWPVRSAASWTIRVSEVAWMLDALAGYADRPAMKGEREPSVPALPGAGPGGGNGKSDSRRA
jgi:hypothetical protein